MVHSAVRRQPADDPGNRDAIGLWQGIVRAPGR